MKAPAMAIMAIRKPNTLRHVEKLWDRFRSPRRQFRSPNMNFPKNLAAWAFILVTQSAQHLHLA